MSNEKNSYEGKIALNSFKFKNIEPGTYELKFTAGIYMENVTEVSVGENSQIKNIVKTQNSIEQNMKNM